MYLVIGEKPSVSQALAKVIGAYQKKDGFLLGRDCIVSWCVGHLAEYAPPEVYGETYKKWRFEDLPILPEKLENSGITKYQETVRGIKNAFEPERSGICSKCL